MTLTTTTAPQPQPDEGAALLAAVSSAIRTWEEAHPGLRFSLAHRTEVEGGEPFWTVEWWTAEPRHPTKKTGGEMLEQCPGEEEPAASLVRSLEEIGLRLGVTITMAARPEVRTLVWWDDLAGGQHYVGERS